MNSALKWIVSVAFVAASGIASAQTNYSVNNLAVGSDYLSGTISVTKAAESAGGTLGSANDFTNSTFTLGLYNSAHVLIENVTLGACIGGCGLQIQNGNLELGKGSSALLASLFAPYTVCGIGDVNAGAGCTAILSGSTIGSKFLSDGTVIALSPTTAAPEMNPASAASALTLLVGGLLVLRGRKRQGTAASI